MKEFLALSVKTYSQLKDNSDQDKTTKDTEKCNLDKNTGLVLRKIQCKI